MRRIIMFALICLIGSVQLMANPVTVSQAKEKANQFLNKHAAKRAPGATSTTKTLKMMEAGKDDSYFIFNVEEEGGYVVVSGDDATEEILGYSDTGRIDPDNMPCNMRALFDSYAEQIQFLRKNGITREQNTRGSKAASREFHLDEERLAHFDQGVPYNNLCPIYNNQRTITGCAATAMAQLMFYYQWPSQTTSIIPGYVTDSLKIEVQSVPANTAIEWSNIIKQYNTYYWVDVFDLFPHELWDTEEQVDAIANLMKYAGASVHMDYMDSVSNSMDFNLPFALKKYFGYSSANLYNRSSFKNKDEEWNNLLCNELQNNGPVIYTGQDSKGGHAFMLEGFKYDDDYYYDINFGWDGRYNGKYLLTVVKGEFTYTEDQSAILDVTPQTTLSSVDMPLKLTTKELYAVSDTTDVDVYTRSNISDSFEKICLRLQVWNKTPIDTEFNYGFVFINDKGEEVDHYYDEYNLPLNSGYWRNGTIRFSGHNLVNGKYIIRAISKEVGSDTWLINDNSDNQYVNAIVLGDMLSLQCTGPEGAQLTTSDFNQVSEAPLRVGLQTEYSVKVSNLTSPVIYNGGILVKEMESDQVVFIGKIDELKGLSSSIITFSYSPTTPGEHQLLILNKQWEEIGRFTVNAISANESLDMLEVTDFKLIDGDMERRLIDGTYLRANMSMKNHDAVTKKADITIGLTNVETKTKRTKTIAVNIEPNSSVGYNIGFGNLIADNHYIVTASYSSGEVFYTSSELLCSTEGLGEIESGNESLIQYEYWFDDDIVNRQIVGMGSNNAVIRASINTDSLNYGTHRFNFRVKRSDNKYSAVTSSLFLKKPTKQNSYLEYWFDDNYEQHDVISISATEDEQDFMLDLNDSAKYPHGFHKLNSRVILSDCGESAVYSSAVFKFPTRKISTLELWLDENRENIYTISGNLASDGLVYLFAEDINLGAVTPGHHRLYCRAVSDDGRIASAVTMTPIIVKSKYAGITPADVKITNYSIAIDNEEPITFTLPSPGQDVVVEKKYNVRDLTTGNHQLKLRFNNSIGAGVSDNSTFSVKSQETPVINLTAQESNGLVNIKFNSIPNDISYRIYRVDANGALAYLNQIKGSYYPNEMSFTDNPPTGSYRYYAKGKYESVNGEQPIVTSNEAGVTVSADVAEVIEYGYISGDVQTDVPGFFGKSRNVVFSDGETVKCDNSGRFYRDKIPVGNNLMVTLEADAEYTATTKDITVKAGSNMVHISVERTSGNDYQLVDSDSPLQFTSTYAEVVPGQYYRFEVKNVSGRSWKGRVSVKVLRKDYVDDSKAPYTALKNYNYAYSEEFSIGAGKTREVYLPEIAFNWNALQKDYYFYFECNDGKDTKLIELNPENNIASNPLQRLVEEDAMVSAANEVLEENVTFAVNLIMRMISGVKEIDGKLGDFNDYLKVSKECLGYDIEYLDFDYLSRKIDHVASYDQLFWDNELWRFKTIVYSEANHFEKGINKFREKTATLVRESKDILKVIKDVQQVLEYAKAYNEWQGMEDTERMIYFSERILDYAASHGDPFVKILKTYLDVTRITIANAKLLGGAYHRGFDAVYFSSENHLPESERVGSFKHNRYLDFRIRVKKEDSWWRLVDSNFDAEAVKKQIFDVTVTARNKMGGHGDFRAEATFTPVVDGDYIYLRQTGISGALSLGDGIEDMWMNIRWKNGRTTRVPLRHGSEVEGDGVKYNGLSLPFRYTITFQSGSSDEENMADIIKIDD